MLSFAFQNNVRSLVPALIASLLINRRFRIMNLNKYELFCVMRYFEFLCHLTVVEGQMNLILKMCAINYSYQ